MQFHNGIITTVTCPQIMSSDDSVRVTSYRNPATKGTLIVFSCPPKLILTGFNTSTCMGNGEWEPDPKQTKCEGKSVNCYQLLLSGILSPYNTSVISLSLNSFKFIICRLELQITHEETLSSNLGNLLKKNHPSLME